MTYSIRIASDQDAPDIRRLVTAAGFDVQGLAWARVNPNWLVAENGVGIVGCLQVCPGLPIGRLEMLALDETLDPVSRARAGRMLAIQGCATLKACGAEAAMCMVPFELQSYKRILKKRGAVVVNRGNILVKRL